MNDGLSSYDLNRLARQGDEDNKHVRQGIERTTRIPDEIVTVTNFGIGVVAAEGGGSIMQVIKSDGRQLHLHLRPEARRSLLRELLREDEADAPEADPAERGPGGAVELG